MFPEGTAARTAALALLKQAKAMADYRWILCVHLRAAFGESNPVIAAKTGLSESTIRKVHAAFLQRGEAVLTTRSRGGRRRAHLTVAEAAVVQPFLAKAKAGGVVEIGPIRRDPWLVLTDLSPEVADACWYGLRAWIEQGFKKIKRGGWQWHATRMTDPRRAERL